MCNAAQEKARSVVSADQESWLLQRLIHLTTLVLSIKACHRVGADSPGTDGAVRGAINGTAVEIVRVLGHEPAFENIQLPQEFEY
jgi:hypothetical protein